MPKAESNCAHSISSDCLGELYLLPIVQSHVFQQITRRFTPCILQNLPRLVWQFIVGRYCSAITLPLFEINIASSRCFIMFRYCRQWVLTSVAVTCILFSYSDPSEWQVFLEMRCGDRNAVLHGTSGLREASAQTWLDGWVDGWKVSHSVRVRGSAYFSGQGFSGWLLLAAGGDYTRPCLPPSPLRPRNWRT